MAKSVQIAVLLVLLAAAPLAVAADTLRCGNRLASTGDTKAEVLIKCGAPAWKDDWTDEIINDVNTAKEQRLSIDRERWVYNFGPNAFMRFVLFENGKLIDISAGGYGFNKTRPAGKSCEANEIKRDLTQYEILQRCGEPFFRDIRNEERLTVVDKYTNRLVIIQVDEWTYNFGPNQFLRILKFENGKLVDIETGDRGF